MNTRRKRKPYGMIIFILILVILCCIGLGIFIMKDQIKSVVKEKAGKYAISQAIKMELGEEVDIDQFMEKMEPQDAQKVNELMDKYVNDDTIHDYVGLLKDGGVEAVKDYVGQMADETDVSQIQDLINKYKDNF